MSKRVSTEASIAARAIESLAAHAHCHAIRIVSDISKSEIMRSLGVTNNQVQEVTIGGTRVIITNDKYDEYAASLPTYEIRRDALDSHEYVFLMNQNLRLAISTIVSAIVAFTLIYYGYYHPETSADMFMNFICGVGGLVVFAPTSVYGAALLIQRSRVARAVHAQYAHTIATQSKRTLTV